MSVLLIAIEAIGLASWYLLPSLYAAKSPAAALVKFAVACATGPTIDLGAKRPYSRIASSIFLVLGCIGDIISLQLCPQSPSAHIATGIILSAACCRAILVSIQVALPRQVPAEYVEIATPYHSWYQEIREILQSTILYGFRKVSDVKSLGTPSPELDPERLAKLFDQHWQTADKTSEHCLLDVCKRVLQSTAYPGIMARTFGSLFVYTQPFLLERIILFFDQPVPESRTSLVLSTAIAFAGNSVSIALYNRISYRIHIALNGMLSLVVFQKLDRLGQRQALAFATPSLIDADITSICNGFQSMYRTKNDALHVILGIAVLFKFAGSGCLVVVIGFMISATVEALFRDRAASGNSAWARSNYEKSTEASEVLSQLQIIKVLGLQSMVADKMRKLQATECRLWLEGRYLEMPLRIVHICVDGGTRACLVLYLYLLNHGEVSSRLIFPSLAVSFEVKKALELYLRGRPNTPGYSESLKRVQEYLLQREVVDRRILGATTEGAIECVDLAIAPEGADEPLLQAVNCSFPKGAVTLAVGPSCSGKSTFLQAVAGSAEILQGSIYFDSAALAYCDQLPWLRNSSVKENIVAGLYFDEDRYQKVLQLCLLTHDLEKLEQGDEYVVGHNGMNLSGGQRHRIVSINTPCFFFAFQRYAHNVTARLWPVVSIPQ